MRRWAARFWWLALSRRNEAQSQPRRQSPFAPFRQQVWPSHADSKLNIASLYWILCCPCRLVQLQRGSEMRLLFSSSRSKMIFLPVWTQQRLHQHQSTTLLISPTLIPPVCIITSGFCRSSNRSANASSLKLRSRTEQHNFRRIDEKKIYISAAIKSGQYFPWTWLLFHQCRSFPALR